MASLLSNDSSSPVRITGRPLSAARMLMRCARIPSQTNGLDAQCFASLTLEALTDPTQGWPVYLLPGYLCSHAFIWLPTDGNDPCAGRSHIMQHAICTRSTHDETVHGPRSRANAAEEGGREGRETAEADTGLSNGDG